MPYRILVTIATLLLSMTVAVSPADAKPTPKLTLTIAVNRVDQNTDITISVDSSRLGKGGKMILQRTAGTGKTFVDVGKVAKQGSTTVAGVPVGKYKYRLAFLKRGKPVAYSNTTKVYSYGPLTGLQLCDRSEHTDFDVSCGAGTVPVGTNVFAYTNYQAYYSGSGPTADQAIIATKSSCRSLTIDYAVSNTAADNGVTAAALALTQETADMQTASTPARTVGTTTFSIASRAWDLIAWSEGESGAHVYFRGVFSCYTTDGDK